MNYTRYTQRIMGLVHINDIVVSTWKHPACSQHVTGVSTWGLYSKCTIACYWTVTIKFLIVTVNMEFHIIILISCNFVFRLWSFLHEFRFFSFLPSFVVCVSLHESGSRWVWGWRMCSSLTVRSHLWHESSTWTRNFELGLGLESSTGTHIC